jgi:hypothetical protein
MDRIFHILALPLAFGIVSCAEPVAAPHATAPGGVLLQRAPGSGLILNSLTGLSVPLVGQLGTVDIDQAVITNFTLVENTVGQIIGLEAEGILQLTGGVLGTDVITEDFSTLVTVTSSGPGQCDLVTIDLGPIAIDALGLATLDIPAASVTGRGSGAVGSLLCNLGSLLNAITGGITSGVQGLVNQIDALI